MIGATLAWATWAGEAGMGRAQASLGQDATGLKISPPAPSLSLLQGLQKLHLRAAVDFGRRRRDGGTGRRAVHLPLLDTTSAQPYVDLSLPDHTPRPSTSRLHAHTLTHLDLPLPDHTLARQPSLPDHTRPHTPTHPHTHTPTFPR
jgi:hypothetical protein